MKTTTKMKKKKNVAQPLKKMLFRKKNERKQKFEKTKENRVVKKEKVGVLLWVRGGCRLSCGV